MKIRLSQKDRKVLMNAGYKRQTIRKWIVEGVDAHQSTRHYVQSIIGYDPWAKKKNGKVA